jgi:hypothetical protein
MKKSLFTLFIIAVILLYACNTEEESERFRLLTAVTWGSDSLLAEGVDAGGPGQILEKFKGDAKFNKDGTGQFGLYTGTWRFSYGEANLVIDSDSLQVPLTAVLAELTAISLKITTIYPNLLNPSNPVDIRMTFKAK